jgi:hypothetical protein
MRLDPVEVIVDEDGRPFEIQLLPHDGSRGIGILRHG